MAPPPCFMGIDVAQATLDIAVRPTAETWQVSNDEPGLTPLVPQRQPRAPALLVLEATGGYQGPGPAAGAPAGLPGVVGNPRQVRAFAQAVGILAKTDRIDARGIAHFAAAVRPTPRPRPDVETQELRARVLRRRQVLALLTAERNRLGTAPARIQRAIQPHRAWLEGQLGPLDDDLTTRIERSAVWQAKADLLRSIPGAGRCCRARCWPRCQNWAPWATGRGPRWSGWPSLTVIVAPCGGAVRSGAMLYLGALVATRHNPVIQAWYERRRAAGKAKKVALTACMHKLLTIMNAMGRNRTPWQPREVVIA